ncbi:MAG TPA: CHAD domain-containing protein [Vicinamibacterales bacterium]|jgi:CHAD domain-containing protein
MRSPAVHRALARRLLVLDRDLPAALQFDAEALHRTRVASRRLREVLPALPSDGRNSGNGYERDRRQVRARVRRLTRALGGVRELDVALALLEEYAGREPALACLRGTARLAIEQERDRRRGDMVRRLEAIDAGKLLDQLSRLARQATDESRAERTDRLRRRVRRRARRLLAAVDEAGALYAFDRLHLVRIAAKKLRYALELVQEVGGVRTLRFVKRLKQVQDLLGRLHDLEVLAGQIRRLATGAAADGESGADHLLELITRETRELHGAYLSDVGRIVGVAEASIHDLDRRLHAAPPRPLAG